ncbi:MAG TPA: isoprenylcysteine carboxylmethyltransferase family protein [Longimicrobiaceae bacterium]|nr:isoprenylcysteine carboxylmethyltransferase family protein [Longimicrobiaceae bacterium]
MPLVLRLIVFLLAYVALFAALLFAPAPTLAWWDAYVLLAAMLIVRTAGVFDVYRVNPELLAERAGMPIRSGQPLADRMLLATWMASFAAHVAFCSADVWRLRLLPPPVFPLRMAGLALFVFGWWVAGRVLRDNAFAVTTVRHQAERAHRVADSGVYAVVRHPMYAAMIPVMVGMALWLGSTAGILAAAVPMSILVARIVLEERFLRRTLAGYAEYAARVRWRLIPGLW